VLDDALVGGRTAAFYAEVKADLLVELVRRELGDAAQARALDVGCGPGLTDGFLVGRFGELHGVDVSQPMVERAAIANPDAHYRVTPGDRLPYDDGTFDLAFAVNVFHHVEGAGRSALARELARVVRPGGLVAIAEHNPLNPLTRLVVSRCAFDEGVELLPWRETESLLRMSGLELVQRRYLLFVPWRAPRLERVLAPVPLGAQYLVAAAKPRR
jgi:SAM-dependent methyltransferase